MGEEESEDTDFISCVIILLIVLIIALLFIIFRDQVLDFFSWLFN